MKPPKEIVLKIFWSVHWVSLIISFLIGGFTQDSINGAFQYLIITVITLNLIFWPVYFMWYKKEKKNGGGNEN
jgi:hypothetical protein